MSQVRIIHINAQGRDQDHDPATAELTLNSITVGEPSSNALPGAISVENGIDLNDSIISNVKDPIADQDAATKKYVDDIPRLLPTDMELAIITNSKLSSITSSSKNVNGQLALLNYADMFGYSNHTLTLTYNIEDLVEDASRSFTYEGQVWTYTLRLDYDIDGEFAAKTVLDFSRI